MGRFRRFRSLRRLSKRTRALLTQPLLRLAALVVPPLYTAYMRLVWSTSHFEDLELRQALARIRHSDGAVAVFWHEEVIAAPYAWSRSGLCIHTLVNQSPIGDLASRIAERCGFVAFRGGSSSRASRRRATVVRDMIDHMREGSDVIYGLPVDGSQGPVYRMKRGAVVIARDCDRPVILARVWFRRCLRLPTWDRIALPMPCNAIRLWARGPYAVPADANSREGLERFRLRLEDELIDLATQSYLEMGHEPPRNLVPDPRAGELAEVGT